MDYLLPSRLGATSSNDGDKESCNEGHGSIHDVHGGSFLGGIRAWAGRVGASHIVVLLGSWTEASQDVWECWGADIHIVTIDEGTIADVMLVTAPKFTVLVVWSIDHMAILGESNDVTIGGGIRVGSVDGELNWIVHASLRFLAHAWGHGGACITIALLVAWGPHVVVILLGGGWMSQALIQGYPLVLNGILVAGSKGIEDVGTGESYT